MALPTSYSENSLARYMLKIVRAVAADLALTVDLSEEADPNDPGVFAEPINDILSEMSVATLSDIDSSLIRELRLRAKYHAWQHVVESYVTALNIGGLARTIEREALFTHARDMRADAKAELDGLLTGQLTDGMFDGAPFANSGRLWLIPVFGGGENPYRDEEGDDL